MSSERNKIHKYCISEPLKEGVSAVEQATAGHVSFSKDALPPIEGDMFVETYTLDEGSKVWTRDRNPGGLNTNLHSTKLVVGADEINKPIITPQLVLMQSRDILRDEYEFAGYTESEVHYESADTNNRIFRQDVKVFHIPSEKSPFIETLTLQRQVLDYIGDCTYGLAILNNKGQALAEELGVVHPAMNEVFLTFTSEHVLATSYNNTVIDKFTYEQVRSLGFSVNYTDTPEKAELSLAAGNLSFKLWLDKKLKEDYPQYMFSEFTEEWIADGGVVVGKIPADSLN